MKARSEDRDSVAAPLTGAVYTPAGGFDMSPVRVHMFARVTFVCAIAALASQPFAAAADAITRTVYLTITDAKGAAVGDLTPANFKV